MNDKRGAIFAPEAYARGKMLESDDWHGLLPRNITPSDIDAVVTDSAFPFGENLMIVDNDKKILLMEFSTHTCLWSELKYGQRLAYANLVRVGKGAIMGVCALVSPEYGKAINTVKDIVSFQVMQLDKNRNILYRPVIVNESGEWIKFVQSFPRLLDCCC